MNNPAIRQFWTLCNSGDDMVDGMVDGMVDDVVDDMVDGMVDDSLLRDDDEW